MGVTNYEKISYEQGRWTDYSVLCIVCTHKQTDKDHGNGGRAEEEGTKKYQRQRKHDKRTKDVNKEKLGQRKMCLCKER